MDNFMISQLRYLKTYKLFEFVEKSSNTPLLYKDNNVEVKVVKTFDATKNQNKDTNWCSTKKTGFYSHNKTANMYRINFKDGYKLRLTWDYITQMASELGSYSGGTHWGQGGVVDGEELSYDVFRPRDNDDPFYINWESESKREIVNRIKSLPTDAIDSMKEYQNKSSIEKTANLNKLYSEIQKIKVIDCELIDDDKMNTIIDYRGKTYKLLLTYGFWSGSRSSYIRSLYDHASFKRDFKNKYGIFGIELPNYIYDKCREFLKKSNH